MDPFPLISLKDRLKQHTDKVPGSHQVQLHRIALFQAIQAGLEGNYPVGAVIADQNYNLLAKGRNSSFKPAFRSEAHAEMNAITEWESSEGFKDFVKGGVLFSTLEPCLMCASRIMLSKLVEVQFLWRDPTASVTGSLGSLPPNYRELSSRIGFSEFKGDPELRSIAEQLYQIGEELWSKEYSLQSPN